MNLPFTPDQFFDVFGAYNGLLWPFALALWLYAVVVVIAMARSHKGGGRFVASHLAIHWTWAAVAYHAVFFSRINPAAWIFAAAFLIQAVFFVWIGVVRRELRFSAIGSWRHKVAWMLIVYSLIYPLLANVDHPYPETPTFGVPCPTTLLTAGLLIAAEPPWPRVLAIVPILWCGVAGSAAVLLGVRADLMLWVAGAALAATVLVQPRKARGGRVTLKLGAQ